MSRIFTDHVVINGYDLIDCRADSVDELRAIFERASLNLAGQLDRYGFNVSIYDDNGYLWQFKHVPELRLYVNGLFERGEIDWIIDLLAAFGVEVHGDLVADRADHADTQLIDRSSTLF